MALKGNLRDFSLHKLLNLIHLAHRTGVLTLSAEDGRGERTMLYFREGKLIYAALDHRATRLTDILVKAAKLTPEQAHAVHERARLDTDKELGLLLIHNGYLSQGDIIQGVRSYLLETVYRLFTWPGGEFRFETNQLPPEERITVPVNLETVIIEAGRRQQQFERLREEIPDLDVPLSFARRPNTNLKNVSLRAEEWKVISFVNSRNTSAQIAKTLGLDDFQIRRIVHLLRAAGLIEIAQPSFVPDGAPPAPAPGVRLSRPVLLRIIDGIRRR